MKKADRLKLEQDTYYRVAKAFGPTGDIYEARRFLKDELQAVYHVTLNRSAANPIIWCDCTGFRIQKFAHKDHKHIKLVAHFQALQELAEDVPIKYVEYRIKGTGANATIHHVITVWEDNSNET